MSIRLDNVEYIYGEGTAMNIKALSNINIEINKGEFVGLIGHTGSGKSTLIQHFNGLVKPTSGDVYYGNKNIFEKSFNLRDLRCKVGLVFQYPEHQLFETSVYEDVSYGPQNLELESDEIKKRVDNSLKLVGLGEEYYNKSPFELSGGEKRRVAIAGVLAMEPEYLILDEPTAGLDPKGRHEILEQISFLKREKNISVVLVSHSMEDIAEYVDRVIVMNKGRIEYDDVPRKVFSNYIELEKMGLMAPQITYLMHELNNKGMQVNKDITTLFEAKNGIIENIKKGKKKC